MYVVRMCTYKGEMIRLILRGLFQTHAHNLHQGFDMQRLLFNELGYCHGGHSCFVPEKLSLQLFLFDISLQLPLYPRVWTERIIHDKVIQDLHPRRVLRQVIVILSCYFLHLKRKSKAKNKF